MLQTRAVFPPILITIIVIKHPDYRDDIDRLPTLPAHDDPEGGFNIDTAQTMYGILTGNRWDGFFTQDRNGPPVQVLKASARYFILPDESLLNNICQR